MPLYLTADEKRFFASMKPELTGGWQVEQEALEFTDTPERRKLRFELLRLSDPSLKQAKERIVAAKSEAEFQQLLKTLDFSQIGNHDFSRLLFALGPDALSLVVQDVMGNAATKDDVELVAALAGLRHLMLESLVEADF